MKFPYHPNYGLTDDLRQRVINYIKETGSTQAEAARTFKVAQSSVSLWVRGKKREGFE